MRMSAVAVLAICTVTAAAHARDWSADFPELACRVPHFDERLNSDDRDVRLSAVRTVLMSERRNSKLLPPFFRALLRDPDPEIAWTALSGLGDHDLAVAPDELPARIEVPLAGRFNVRDFKDRLRLRRLALRGSEALEGWALRALMLIGDEQTVTLAEPLAKSDNAFVRFNAAAALLRNGKPELAILFLQALVDRNEYLYGLVAAELLARHGNRDALEYLQRVLDARVPPGQGSSKDLVRDILADLTGVYPASRARSASP